MESKLKVVSLVAKFLSLVIGLAAYTNYLPTKWAAFAAIVFAIASVLKDATNRIGDLLDDGKENQSFQAK